MFINALESQIGAEVATVVLSTVVVAEVVLSFRVIGKHVKCLYFPQLL